MQASARGIEVEHLARSFGAVHAVRDVSFVARPGTITGLIGPNGAGKTTLLLMLATLVAPDAGTIRIDGLDPENDARAARARIGWMPDTLGSWPTLTVRTSIELTGRMYGKSASDAAARADQLLDIVDLRPLANAASRVLSRGQKQRLSLARALVNDPTVLLLDEPASGLDPEARIGLRELLKGFAAEGRTILVSSHVLAELDEFADAAVYLDAGVSASPERVAATKSTARDWRIRAIDQSLVRPALAKAGIAEAAVKDDGDATLVSLATEADAAALLTALVKAKVQVVAFAPAVGDLEHAFLDLREGAT